MKKKIQYIKSIDLEIMYKKSYPDIDKIIWNKPATIVFLKTGEKGICKVQPGDKWNRELGFWVAYAKALQEKDKPYRKMSAAVGQCMRLVQKAIEYKKVKLQEKCVGMAPVGDGSEYIIPTSELKKFQRDGVLNLSGLK